MQAPTRRQKIFAIVIFIATVLLSLSVFIFPINPKQLAVFGYGGMFLLTLLGAMTLFVPAPTMVAAFVIGSALNPLLVSLVAGLGSALGETTGYLSGYATRALIADPSEKSRWYWRILGWIMRYPFLTLFLFSAIPNFITDVAGLIAGRIRYPYPKYLLATFLGKTIRFGIGAFLGAELGKYFLPH
jgi:membrane protein YqaA with SNARE-associated domain